jgi:uncharacterized protein YyaL (SSP411 family)
MTDDVGGFHSAEDADSEGVEGKFYVWTPATIQAVLGEERARVFCLAYDVTTAGNFEHGQSILHLPRPLSEVAAEVGLTEADLSTQLAMDRAELLQAREQRVRPGKDDKVLVSWNALMIEALARAAGVLREPRYLQAAEKASLFLHQQLRDEQGRLLHCWRQGKAKLPAYLDDYAYLANAWVTMFETTGEAAWLERACELADQMLRHFADHEAGGFFFTADDHEQLIVRSKDLHDSSVPSGNAMAATALVRLAKLTGNQAYLAAAERTLQTAVGLMQSSPAAAGQWLLALDLYLGPTAEIVLVGDLHADELQQLWSDMQQRFIPRQVFAAHQQGTSPPRPLEALLAGKEGGSGLSPRVYVCQDFACQAPVEGAAAIRSLWARLAESRSHAS